MLSTVIANIEPATVVGSGMLGAAGATIVFGVNYFLKRKRQDDKEVESERDAKRKADKDGDDMRDSLREIDAKLAKAGKDLTQHQLDDAQSFAHLETQQAVMETKINHISQTTSIMAADLKEVLRRTPRNGAERAGE